MNISFRATQNLGLGILLSIILITGIVFDILLDRSVTRLRELTRIEELQLENRYDIYRLSLNLNEAFHDYARSESRFISPVMRVLDEGARSIDALLLSSAGKRESSSLSELSLSIDTFSRLLQRLDMERHKNSTGEQFAMAIEAAAGKTAKRIGFLSMEAIRSIGEGIIDEKSGLLTTVQYHRKLLRWIVSVAIFCTLLVALYMKRALAIPVTGLLKSAGRMAEGDFSGRIRVGPGDEIGELCSAFNRMAERLCESREKLAAPHMIIACMSEMLIVIDPSGRIRTLNRSVFRQLGYLEHELIGRTPAPLFPPGSTLLKEITGRVLENGSPVRMETVCLSRSGSRIPVLLSASLMRNEAGAPDGIILTATEFTYFKKTEQALIKARDDANKASNAKSIFLANMSHEIRTPMNGVIGMARLLLDTRLTPEQQQCTMAIKNSADSLMTVINDILDFSKIESGRLDLEVSDFDLLVMLEDINDILGFRAREKGLEYFCRISPDVPLLLSGDPGRLRQIIVNLVGNAVKFTPKGEIVMEVTRTDKKVDGDKKLSTIRFSVTDTGIGIPESRKEALFDAYTQADPSATRNYEGTGLGLSICRLLSKMMKGDIGVESREHCGSTFWFTAVVEESSRDTRPHVAYTRQIYGARILVVDENPSSSSGLMDQLTSWQFTAEGAPGADAALSKLTAGAKANAPFSLAILHEMIGGMGARNLGRKIKSDPLIGQTSLIMMTTEGMRGDADRFEKIGFSGYFTTPHRKSELFNCIAAVLYRNTGKKDGGREPIITRHTICENLKQMYRLLLVEDDPVNQQVALGILKKLGFRAHVASNGKEAIRALERNPYDLVFMDIRMPEMDGFTATEIIRNPLSGVKNHRIPIIAMTAHAMRGDRKRCMDAGMSGYIPKPIDPGGLYEILKTHLPADGDEGLPSVGIRLMPAAASRDKEAGSPVFDRAALMSRLGDDEMIYKEIMELFFSTAPDEIEDLRVKVSSDDPEAIREQAHKVKGMFSSISAVALHDIAHAVETAAKENRLEGCKLLMTSLAGEFAGFSESVDSSDG